MIIDELNLTEKDWYKNKAEKRRKEAIDYFEKKQELIMETLKQEINEKMEEFKKQEKEFQAQSKELWDLQNIYSQLDNIRVDFKFRARFRQPVHLMLLFHLFHDGFFGLRISELPDLVPRPFVEHRQAAFQYEIPVKLKFVLVEVLEQGLHLALGLLPAGGEK